MKYPLLAAKRLLVALLHSRKANVPLCQLVNIAIKAGDFMPADDKSEIEELDKKLDSLADDLTAIRDDLKPMDSLPDMEKNVDSLKSDLKEVQSRMADIEKLNNTLKNLGGFEKKIDKTAESIGKIEKAIDAVKNESDTSEIAKGVEGLQESIDEILKSKENEVIIKKLDDLLLYFTDSDVLVKKLDDLQTYVAGLSGIEEKVEELSNNLSETNEIVSIIVRQLDDIERKYNQTIDRIAEVADDIEASLASADSLVTSGKAEKKPSKTESNTAGKAVSKASLPSTIDQIMTDLMALVTPQTDAKDMARFLEEARDRLTTMISGHTPVLYQFGTKARELKSYPPTATLNENDIALLSKDIRSWTSKLKEMAKSQ